MLKFRDDAPQVYASEEFWYMLNNYINLEEHLEPESVKKVQEAMDILQELEDGIEWIEM